MVLQWRYEIEVVGRQVSLLSSQNGLCTAQIQANYYSHALFIVCVLILFPSVHVKYAVAKLVEAGRSLVLFLIG
jgi:preprotein translocase subunit SecB